jgi:hypothetical protein
VCADKRTGPDKIYVISDNNEITWPQSWVYAPGSVCEKKGFAPHATKDFNGHNNALPARSLVKMTPPTPRRDQLSGAAIKNKLSAVPFYRGCAKPGDVAILQPRKNLIAFDCRPPTATEKNTYVRRALKTHIGQKICRRIKNAHLHGQHLHCILP